MSNLKSIVPPLELCKQIPAGEFEDSVFAWRYPAYDERNRRLLNGWNDSKGATMEFEKAREASLNLFFEEEIYMIINRILQKENPTIRIKDRKNAALQL